MLVNLVILATAVLSLIAAVVGAVRSARNSRQIQEVHLIMNSRMTDALSRIQQLGNALQSIGVKIPDDPSLKGNGNDSKAWPGNLAGTAVPSVDNRTGHDRMDDGTAGD